MDDIIETAHQYWRSYAILGRAHYVAWERAARKNTWLGIPVVVTTTIVGTAIFGSIQENPAIGWKVAAGLLSLSAAVLSALQTTLKYSELAEKHKMAGAKYSAVRRRLDLFILKHSGQLAEHREAALQELEEIMTKIAELAEESPSLPDTVYSQAEQEFKSADKRPATLKRERDA